MEESVFLFTDNFNTQSMQMNKKIWNKFTREQVISHEKIYAYLLDEREIKMRKNRNIKNKLKGDEKEWQNT